MTTFIHKPILKIHNAPDVHPRTASARCARCATANTCETSALPCWLKGFQYTMKRRLQTTQRQTQMRTTKRRARTLCTHTGFHTQTHKTHTDKTGHSATHKTTQTPAHTCRGAKQNRSTATKTFRVACRSLNRPSTAVIGLPPQRPQWKAQSGAGRPFASKAHELPGTLQ